MKDFNDVFNSLKKTMEEEIRFNREIESKIEEVRQNIINKEDQLEMLSNMKVQLQMSLKADREELKMLLELAEKKQANDVREQIKREQTEKYQQELYELKKENYKLQETIKQMQTRKKWSI